MIRKQIALGLAALLLASAAEGEWNGELGLEGRIFTESALDDDQRQAGASLRLQLEYFCAFGDGSLVVKPFLRLDSADDERTHADLREAYWHHVTRSWELRVGFNKVFWGVTESRHLVDVINQTDLVENPDGEAKLGQPMVQLTLPRDWGTTHLFLLPYFRERTFPGEHGRLRTPLPVDTDLARYESGAEQHHLDLALRYQRVIGPVDLGLSYFDGTNRDPGLALAFRNGRPVLAPYYEQIRQLGLDLQYTADAWLWKLEALHRRGEQDLAGEDDGYFAAVAGFEYTFFGISEAGADLGVLMEYLYDQRGDQATTPFQNDLFLGLRWAANDVAGTAVLAGTIIDLEHGAQSWRLEADRRLSDSWTISLEAMAFVNPHPRDGLYGLRRDDYVALELVYWF